MLKGLKNANLALMFFLELGVLISLGYWGFSTGSAMLAKIGLGLGAPVLAVVVWALFGAPLGKWHLYGAFSRLALKVIFFGSAAVALYASGQQVLGAVFALLFLLNAVLSAVWKQDPQPASA